MTSLLVGIPSMSALVSASVSGPPDAPSPEEKASLEYSLQPVADITNR